MSILDQHPAAPEQDEPTVVTPEGVPVPLSQALVAVDRCVAAIRTLDHYLALLKQADVEPEASAPLMEVRLILTGDPRD